MANADFPHILFLFVGGRHSVCHGRHCGIGVGVLAVSVEPAHAVDDITQQRSSCCTKDNDEDRNVGGERHVDCRYRCAIVCKLLRKDGARTDCRFGLLIPFMEYVSKTKHSACRMRQEARSREETKKAQQRCSSECMVHINNEEQKGRDNAACGVSPYWVIEVWTGGGAASLPTTTCIVGSRRRKGRYQAMGPDPSETVSASFHSENTRL
jgi:hypothetical protein